MSDDLKREQAEARRDGAVPVKNSGRGLNKCDALLDNFGIDYKHAEKSFTLNPTIWSKVTSDAYRNGRRMGTVKVVFEGTNFPLRLWVISDDNMHEYLELLRFVEGLDYDWRQSTNDGEQTNEQ